MKTKEVCEKEAIPILNKVIREVLTEEVTVKETLIKKMKNRINKILKKRGIAYTNAMRWMNNLTLKILSSYKDK